MNQDATIFEKMFDLLDRWRMYPAYQLERRVDIIFATFLPELLHAKFGKKVITLLPEFPVRVGDVYPKVNINKSFRIDYVAVREDMSVLFVEFKTDMTSRRDKQDDYLVRAKNNKLYKLINGLIIIYGATNQKKKYMNFMIELKKIGWLTIENDKIKNKSTDCDIEIVYIQPTNENNDSKVISFDDCINFLQKLDDPVSRRFIASLERWKINPNS